MKIELKIPGKQPRKFSFRFDFNAMAEYEELFDKSPTDIKGMGASNTRNIAYIGFKEADPDFDLTLKEVGTAMTMDVFNKVIEAFSRDMSLLNGEEPEEGEVKK